MMRYVVIILKELILDSDIDMDVITSVIDVKVIPIGVIDIEVILNEYY